MDREYEKEGLDTSLDQFDGYEDYLNSHITSIDTSYLEDEELARQLVELGVQGKGEILSKEEFAAEAEKLWTKPLDSLGGKSIQQVT